METQSKSELRKKLYLAARERVDLAHKNCAEIVKLCRDSFVAELYEKSYDKLSVAQLLKVIKFIESQNKPTKEKFQKSASPRELSLLRFFSMKCALRYCDWDSVSFIVGESELTGAKLQSRVEHLYLGRQELPKNVISYMFSSWINAKCNQFLLSLIHI